MMMMMMISLQYPGTRVQR